MRRAVLALILTYFALPVFSQYYLRGDVKDESGKLLSGVRIKLFSKGNYPYSTGSSGSFGIPTSVEIDSITLTYDGYEVVRKKIATQQYQSFVLKPLPATSSLIKHKLSSLTKNLAKNDNHHVGMQGESYSPTIENAFIDTKKYPETGFALNIDRASYSNIRRFINNDMFVPADAVRIEEMLNYFSFPFCTDPLKQKGFAYKTQLTSCPWNKENQLLFVNLKAPKLNLDSVPASNLVFLIDISGSMDKPNRLPLLQTGFKMLVENLRDIDRVTIVVYGGGVFVPLAATPGNEKDKINSVIDSLTASGDTPGEGAIRTAYANAKNSFIKNGNNRVILATDGDFNVGQVSEQQLEDMITNERNSGIYLTCLGVGMGNYKDSKLEALAKKGNGNFAYIDNAKEAEKVLVTEFTKTLYTVAHDVYYNISFNPDQVKEYRLIGFDNKQDAISDSTSELEGGEVGSAHSLMAVFEIKPNKKDTIDLASHLAKSTLQYKFPKTDSLITQKFSIPNYYKDISLADSSLRFAASLIMFGSLLKQSEYTKELCFYDIFKIAKSAAKSGDHSQQEFLSLLQRADKIYNGKKKRKKSDWE